MYINLSNLRIIEAVFGSKSERCYIVEGSPDSIRHRFESIGDIVPVLVIPHCGDDEYEELRRSLGNVCFSINIDENSSLEKLGICIIAVMEQVASFIHSVKKAAAEKK
jgi:hypothetical protein